MYVHYGSKSRYVTHEYPLKNHKIVSILKFLLFTFCTHTHNCYTTEGNISFYDTTEGNISFYDVEQNDVKQTCSVIKDTLQRKRHSSPSSKFIVNNNTITDFGEITTECNKFFINIGRSLSDQIQSNHSSLDYLPKQHKPTSIFSFNHWE